MKRLFHINKTGREYIITCNLAPKRIYINTFIYVVVVSELMYRQIHLRDTYGLTQTATDVRSGNVACRAYQHVKMKFRFVY